MDEALQGGLQVLRSPLALAALLAAGMLASSALPWAKVALLSACAAASTGLPAPPAWMAAAAATLVILLGFGNVARWRAGNAGASLAAIGGGIACGWSADFALATPPEIATGTAVAFGVAGLAASVHRSLQGRAYARIGTAILGAWITAHAALMLLLALRR